MAKRVEPATKDLSTLKKSSFLEIRLAPKKAIATYVTIIKKESIIFPLPKKLCEMLFEAKKEITENNKNPDNKKVN